MKYEEFRQEDGYYYVIYKVINLLNDKFYVGMHKTKDLDDSYMGSGFRIKKAIEKYGKVNFKKEYLYFLNNYNELKNKEREIITEEFLLNENCYNVVLGGSGNFDRANARIKWLRENDINWSKNKGKKVSESLATSEKHKNKIYTKEFIDALKERSKLGKYKRGFITSQETKDKISKANKGKTVGIKNGAYGNKWIYNKEQNIFKSIKGKDLEYYISIGWILKSHSKIKGKIVIKNLKLNKMKYILKENLEEYLKSEWVRGRL